MDIFTTIKVVDSVPLLLERHVERLTSFMVPGSWFMVNNLSSLIKKFIQENRIINAALRVDMSKNGEVSYSVRSLPEASVGVTAVTVIPSARLPQVKQKDRRVYEEAHVYAKERGVNTFLFARNDFLLESPISNIISLDEEGNMFTPSLQEEGLKGITRSILLEGKQVKEREITVDTKGPVVLINCLRIQGVISLNGRKLKDSRDLIKKIQRAIENYAEPLL